MLLIDGTNPILSAEEQQSLTRASASSRGYMTLGLFRKDQVRQAAYMEKRPAMREWSLAVIDRDENSTLPRGIARRIAL